MGTNSPLENAIKYGRIEAGLKDHAEITYNRPLLSCRDSNRTATRQPRRRCKSVIRKEILKEC